MADNSGDINLRSVGLKNGSPKYVIAGTDSWSYSYNPCYGFSSTYFTDLAVGIMFLSIVNLGTEFHRNLSSFIYYI